MDANCHRYCFNLISTEWKTLVYTGREALYLTIGSYSIPSLPSTFSRIFLDKYIIVICEYDITITKYTVYTHICVCGCLGMTLVTIWKLENYNWKHIEISYSYTFYNNSNKRYIVGSLTGFSLFLFSFSSYLRLSYRRCKIIYWNWNIYNVNANLANSSALTFKLNKQWNV